MLNEQMGLYLLISAVGSLMFSGGIVATQGWHGRHSLDMHLAGAQKFHAVPVPRVGGVAVACGILVSLVAYSIHFYASHPGERIASPLFLLLAAAPAFLGGFIEDLTKRVPARVRLGATLSSGLLFCALFGATLSRLGVAGLDAMLAFVPVAIALTMVAISGVTNAINVIDGFNGLAGLTVSIILAALSLVAWRAGDAVVAELALIGLGAVIGFLVLNYPKGKLFLGDGGAYLAGFWIAALAVLVVDRNPSVNPWQVLAICTYPVLEVLFSMYRKKYVRGMSPCVPDRLHLHMLVYRRLVRRVVHGTSYKAWLGNAAVVVFLGPYVLLFAVLALGVGRTTAGALAVIALQTIAYLAVYARLIRGRWCISPGVMLGLRPAVR